MPDILIRGVSLPEGEFNYISLWIYGDGCVYVSNDAIAVSSQRLQDLAISLPEGHGRLGDLDAIAEDLQFDIENDQRALDNLNIVGKVRECIQLDRDCKQYCMRYLSNCHDIIPAEGGETDGNQGGIAFSSKDD